MGRLFLIYKGKFEWEEYSKCLRGNFNYEKLWEIIPVWKLRGNSKGNITNNYGDQQGEIKIRKVKGK